MNYRGGGPGSNQLSPNIMPHSQNHHQPNGSITSRSQVNSSSRPRSHNALNNSSLEDFRNLGGGGAGNGLLN